MFVGLFGMIASVGLSNLILCDMSSSRNLFIIGFAFFMGLSLPEYFDKFPLGAEWPVSIKWLGDIITTVGKTGMAVGGIIGLVLDNLVPALTRKEASRPGRKPDRPPSRLTISEPCGAGFAANPAQFFCNRPPRFTRPRMPEMPSLLSYVLRLASSGGAIVAANERDLLEPTLAAQFGDMLRGLRIRLRMLAATEQRTAFRSRPGSAAGACRMSAGHQAGKGAPFFSACIP